MQRGGEPFESHSAETPWDSLTLSKALLLYASFQSWFVFLDIALSLVEENLFRFHFFISSFENFLLRRQFQVVKILPFTINKNHWFHLNESFYDQILLPDFRWWKHSDGSAFDRFSVSRANQSGLHKSLRRRCFLFSFSPTNVFFRFCIILSKRGKDVWQINQKNDTTFFATSDETSCWWIRWVNNGKMEYQPETEIERPSLTKNHWRNLFI